MCFSQCLYPTSSSSRRSCHWCCVNQRVCFSAVKWAWMWDHCITWWKCLPWMKVLRQVVFSRHFWKGSTLSSYCVMIMVDSHPMPSVFHRTSGTCRGLWWWVKLMFDLLSELHSVIYICKAFYLSNWCNLSWKYPPETMSTYLCCFGAAQWRRFVCLTV